MFFLIFEKILRRPGGSAPTNDEAGLIKCPQSQNPAGATKHFFYS